MGCGPGCNLHVRLRYDSARAARATRLLIRPAFRLERGGPAPADSPSACSHIFVRALSGGSSRQVTRDPSVRDTAPSLSRDGHRIVFARAARRRPYSMGGTTWDDWDVYTIGVDTARRPRRVT